MSFWETLFAGFVAKKIVDSFDKDERPSGSSSIRTIRSEYWSYNRVNSSMLHTLIGQEPDLTDKSTGEDFREYLHLQVHRYSVNGQMQYGDKWFTLSVKNRFFAGELLDDLMIDNIRDCELISFRNRPFNPIVDIYNHSISIDKYTLYFDHPYFFNVSLLLIKDADAKFNSGVQTSNAAINYPPIVITDDIIKEYNINIDIDSLESCRFNNASCFVLNDFNNCKSNIGDFKKGYFELSVVDGKNQSTRCCLHDLLTRGTDVGNTVWIAVDPPEIGVNGTILLGTQFNFLDSADDVIIRGNINTLEIFVCRLSEGYGGIKFKVSNIHDYYKMATWLIIAVTYYCGVVHGWDIMDNLDKYLPSKQEI